MHTNHRTGAWRGACALAIALFSAACTSNRARDGAHGARGGVLRKSLDGPGEASEGTRYITTLGLPSDMVIHYPDWIVNPGIENLLGSVGVAGPSALGTREQVEEARTAARLELARMLETRIQGIGRGELEEHRLANGELDDPAADGEGRRSRLGIERDITDLVLSGSRQRALWFDPLSRDCYVWVVMDGGIPGKAEHFIENGVSVYVANQPIASEYRPARQPEPRPREEPAAAPAPEPPKGPIERLEENLKPIESVPVREKP